MALSSVPVAYTQQPGATNHGQAAQARPLPPYDNLPDIGEMLTEGKNPNRPTPPRPALKPPTTCGYRDIACQKIKEKKEKKIGQNLKPAERTEQQVASAAPKPGGWFTRFRRKVAETLSFNGLSSGTGRGHSFLPGATAKSAATALPMAAPPPPPSFTSLEQAKLDARYRVGDSGEDLFSGNYNVKIPLLSLPGRNGLDLNLTLSYNSLVWAKWGNNISFDYDYYAGLTPGFRLGFPEVSGPYTINGTDTWIATLPSGRRIPLRYVSANKYEAMDSSYLYLNLDPDNNPSTNSLTLYSTDGTQFIYTIPSGDFWYRCTQIKDNQGNYISVSYTNIGDAQDPLYTIGSITDTLGRVLNFNYDTQKLMTITQTWQNQTMTWAQFSYTNLTIQTNFGTLYKDGPVNGAVIPVMNHLITADGARHFFAWNSWGQAWAVLKYGEADNLRTESDYIFPNTSQPLSDCPRFSERRDYIVNWAGANFTGWVSNYFSYDTNETWGQVITPDNVTHKELFSASGGTRGLTTGMETWHGGQKKKWTSLTWTSDSTTSPPLRPRVTESNIYDDADGNGTADNQRRTAISYTTIATTVKLPSITKEYNADATTVYRSSQTTWNTSSDYTNRRIIGLPSATSLYQGDVSSGGTLVAYNEFFYDSPNDATIYLQAHTGTVRQHDSTNYGTGFLYRGNLTRVLRYSVTNGVAGTCPTNCTETKTGYFTTGNVALAKDALGRQTTFYYDDSFLHYTEASGSLSVSTVTPSPATFAYPTRIKDADNFSSTVSYNYDYGAVTRTVDPKEYAANGNSPTTMGISTYDSKGRLDKSLVWKSGSKYSQMRYVYSNDHNWVQTWSTVNTLAEETFVTHMLDGAGRERITLSDHPGSAGGYRAQYVVYDLVGRITEQSNPTEINSGWSPSGDDSGYIPSFQSYDWNHRPLVTTNQDGTTQNVSYTGCGCAGGVVVESIDEVGRKQKAWSDVFGRTVKTEILHQSSGTWTPYASTTTDYNVLDQTTFLRSYQGTATPGSCPTSACQETKNEYDGYNRLWKRIKPIEGSGSPGAIFTYNADDTVEKLTDPRNVEAVFTYNNRRLVTNVSYNVNGSSTIPSAGPFSFTYDQNGKRLSMSDQAATDNSGSVTYEYDVLSRLKKETRTFAGLSGTFPVEYQYNLAGGVTQVKDPFGDIIDYTLDKTGRLSSVSGTPSFGGVTSYTSADSNSLIKYRATDALKQTTYGNGLKLDQEYNSRYLMTRFKITQGSTEKTHTEGQYNADGRMRFVKNLTDGRFDRAYDYDQIGRIFEAFSGLDARTHVNQPRPDPKEDEIPFYQLHAYDAWNHLTSRSGEYWGEDSYFSGIYAANTGRNNAWTYDAAGNITQDSRMTFKYNAAGQTVEAKNTANTQTRASFYDGNGQVVKRVETANGTVTTSRYVYATALGGQLLTELTEQGGKKTTFIYGAGGLLAEQQVDSEGIKSVIWRHNNPISNGTGESWTTGTYYRRTEPDPMGMQLGFRKPFVTPRPPQGDITPGDTSGLSIDLGNCTLDGVYVDCATANRVLGSGAAVVAPEQTTRYNYDKKQFEFFRAYGNGFAGWVPGGTIDVFLGKSDGKPAWFTNDEVFLGFADERNGRSDCAWFVDGLISSAQLWKSAEELNKYNDVPVDYEGALGYELAAKALSSDNHNQDWRPTGWKDKFTQGGQNGGVYAHVYGHAGGILIGHRPALRYSTFSGMIYGPTGYLVEQGEYDRDVESLNAFAAKLKSYGTLPPSVQTAAYKKTKQHYLETAAEVEGNKAGRFVGSILKSALRGEKGKDFNSVRKEIFNRLCDY